MHTAGTNRTRHGLSPVDATVWDRRAMEIWRPVRVTTRAGIWPSLRAERAVLRAARLVLAWSDWARASVTRACPDANVVVNKPGVDIARFRPDGRARVGVSCSWVAGLGQTARIYLAALGPMLGREVELDVMSTDPVAPRTGLGIPRLAPHDPQLVDLYQQADVSACRPTAIRSAWRFLKRWPPELRW